MDKELSDMILDYMNKGFLDNITDMFIHDETLYPLISVMIRDERLRVRIGATALVEELIKLRETPIVKSIPDIAMLLNDPAPTVRGDSANLLGIIKHKDALPFLTKSKDDPDMNVREIIREAIEAITGQQETAT